MPEAQAHPENLLAALLIALALPRVRDFRGVSNRAFDGAGNYSLGLNDQSIFTEIDLDKVKHTIGMNITIKITTKTAIIPAPL